MTADNINSPLLKTALDANDPDDRGSGTTSRLDQDGGGSGLTAVLSADLAGHITACNEAVLKMFGCSAAEILGKTLAVLVAGEGDVEPEKLQETILASVLKHGQFRCSVRCQNRGDRLIAADLSVTLLRDGRSVPAAMVAMLRASDGKLDMGSVGQTALSPATEQEDESPHTICREIDGSAFVLASPLMHRFMRMADRVAGHTETVLITGETGTGKELIARTIHQSSHRRGRSWIDINCAALPENLVESELFGYEKGAFTGADVSKPGLFELADRGTLFLDEIGELQLHTQVKLLRVLDGYPFYRLGGHRKIKVVVRIVAATNQDLEAAVAAGRFRQDLFHRLGQFQLRVPPLRERPEDIVALAEHFLRLKAPGKNFSSQAISALLSHPWPGNIRELRNLVARVAMESSGSEIGFAKVTAAISGEPTALRQTASLPASNLESMEEQMIIKALERTGGQRALAAEQLGISRRTLSRKLKEYNINFAQGSGTP